MPILKKGTRIRPEDIKKGMMITAGEKGLNDATCFNRLEEDIGRKVYRVTRDWDGEYVHFTRPNGSDASCSCEDGDLKYLNLAEDWDDGAGASIIQIAKQVMSDIIQFAKNQNLTPEEKRRVKYGIEAPAGTPTAVGLELSALLSFRAQKAEIDALLKAREEEEDAAKKD